MSNRRYAQGSELACSSVLILLRAPMGLQTATLSFLRAAVSERSDCSPAIKANRVQSPAGTLLEFSQMGIATDDAAVHSRIFSHVGIVPDDAACLRVFSVISHFPPRSCIPALLHTHPASPSSARKILFKVC
ncbi:hypothetical protein PR048_008025 [Dryococelus australis]|uniref:Uncharacterized protein n=1 Tax=Dryococelus australis TaxID=614101 RepID=A0ABQ9HWR6_9NEOP|nr:hypothetical protein PR048_008025 [Dryococelus australis]